MRTLVPRAPVAAPTARDGVVAPAGRRAVLAAHAIALCAVPSGLWRLALAAGLPVGYSDAELHRLFDIPGWGSAHVVAISVVQEVAALSALVLVRPWGDRLPHRAVVVPAAAGAVLLTVVTVSQLLLWPSVPHGGISDAGRTVLGWCYLPLLAWGPLLGYLALDRRGRTPTRPTRPAGRRGRR